MYSVNSVLFLAIIIVIILIWFESLRVRESVTRMCRELCEKSDLQLLDQTVSLASISLRRSVSRRTFLHRIYHFEVSSNGSDRFAGYVSLAGRTVEAVQIDSPEGMTTIYPVTPGQIQ